MRFFKALLPQTRLQATVSLSLSGLNLLIQSVFGYGVKTLFYDPIRSIQAMDIKTFNEALNALPLTDFGRELLINRRNITPVSDTAIALYIVGTTTFLYFTSKYVVAQYEQETNNDDQPAQPQNLKNS